MANSISAEVWLDERRWDALEVVLEEQGSNIEQHLQEYLLDLYREMVPPDQVREIESDIQKEALETQREREARKVFSAFRLWENGKAGAWRPSTQRIFWIRPDSCASIFWRKRAGLMTLPEKSTADTIFL